MRSRSSTFILSTLTASLLAACGGGSGSSGEGPKASSFRQLRYSFGNTASAGPAQVSVDGSGQISIKGKTTVVTSAQLGATELAALSTDTVALLTDISASATPSCPNANGYDYTRFVGITGPDGREYPVRDAAGNLCSYGGKTLDSEKVLNDILTFTAKYDSSINAGWNKISYAFQLASGAPQGDSFVVQSNGQFVATPYQGVPATLTATAASVTPVVGTLTAAELTTLSADVDAILSNPSQLGTCTVAGYTPSSPTLNFTDSGNTLIPIMFALGGICGQPQDSIQLYVDINALARKYMANAGDTWTGIRYDFNGPNQIDGGSMTFSPDFTTIAMQHRDGSKNYAVLSSSDFATLKADVNAMTADIIANSTPSCPNQVGVDTTQLITLSIPSLGGDFKVRNGAGQVCVYNGKSDDANRVATDMDSFRATYFH